MLERILGKEIATYVKRHRGMVMVALALMIVASLFQVVPVYLLQPFVDEGMKTGAAPVAWKIPWFAFDGDSIFAIKRTDVTVINNISPNRLLVLLTLVAFVSIFIKSLTTYLAGLAAASFSNKAVKSVRVDLFQKVHFPATGVLPQGQSGRTGGTVHRGFVRVAGSDRGNPSGAHRIPSDSPCFPGIYLFVMNLKMTLLVFFMVPLIALLIRLFGRKVKKNSTYVQNATADVTSTYHETLLCLKAGACFLYGKRETERFSDLAENLYQKGHAVEPVALGSGTFDGHGGLSGDARHSDRRKGLFSSHPG
jgi:subfamily B ATP-binding cassette protein MsbA